MAVTPPRYSYKNYVKSIVIESGVTSIGSRAFYHLYKLTNVTIPDSVATINGYAFYYCTNLTNITIPNSVTTLNTHTFEYCESLTNVAIPNSVTKIGSCAFYYCTSLTEISIPDSVTEISSNAFCGCECLAELTLSNNLTTIGTSAFLTCKSLKNVTIPSSVTSIGAQTFSGCSSLTSITVSSDNTKYSSADGVLFTKDKTQLVQYPGGKKGFYSIPESVTEICYHSFQACDKLTGLILPTSVTSIGEKAFYNCTAMTDVYYAGTASAWGNITINSNNSSLTEDANIHYNSDGPSTNLSAYTITLSSSSYTYNGSARKPSVTAKSGTLLLTKDAEFTVSYSSNVNAGTASVTIKGNGMITGTVTKTFTITKASNSITASDISKIWSTKKLRISIGAKRKGSAKLSYSSNNSKIKVDSNGKVTIRKKYIGTATITITAAATANYKKTTKKITVSSTPAKVKISKISTSNNNVTVKWKKVNRADGYEIYVSTAPTFTYNTRAKKLNKTKITLAGMTKSQTYYAKVRAYKKVNGKYCYSPWSKIKSVKAE